jgi:hypothetical protein
LDAAPAQEYAVFIKISYLTTISAPSTTPCSLPISTGRAFFSEEKKQKTFASQEELSTVRRPIFSGRRSGISSNVELAAGIGRLFAISSLSDILYVILPLVAELHRAMRRFRALIIEETVRETL